MYPGVICACAGANGGAVAITIPHDGDQAIEPDKPRKRLPGLEELQHPLLGEEPTLKLLPDRNAIRGEAAPASVHSVSGRHLPHLWHDAISI